MFSRNMELQQEKLEHAGRERQHSQQRYETEQRRHQQLQHYLDTLSQSPASNALTLGNRVAMQSQLSQLLDSQHQEVELSRLERDHYQQQLLQQYGRLKGLEQLSKKRSATRALKEKKKEQRQQDDWIHNRR